MEDRKKEKYVPIEVVAVPSRRRSSSNSMGRRRRVNRGGSSRRARVTHVAQWSILEDVSEAEESKEDSNLAHDIQAGMI